LEDGIPNTALREIKALQEIDCEHVVRLREVLPHGSGFVLVFEYMLSDLSEVIRNTDRPLTEAQVGVLNTHFTIIIETTYMPLPLTSPTNPSDNLISDPQPGTM